ncbi:putative ABC transport system permease protein [Leucobacter komagatae]|uniref:Putative ABC transport system permease protein n=1 Tax=Leucobacter komagatae TaxID=55969 RepID=A0A542Y5W4_9MICO|nr:FtsX-like permease family protein [Leucobacter komagatae]TQL43433.1 putative ABC transport system permease protein [Leucobacter komagatae]
MIGLAVSELRAGWEAWVGLVLVSTVAALACGVGVSMIETGLIAGGQYLEGFSGAAGAVLTFTAPAGVVVTAAVARLAVNLGQPTYARWRLAGVSPGQTAAVVLTQVFGSGAAGGVLGYGLASVLAGPTIHSAFEEGSGGYTEIPIVTGPLTLAVCVGGSIVVALLGGARAARSAARTPALAALREPEIEGKRMRWWRWLALGVAVAAAAWCGTALAGVGSVSQFFSLAPILPVTLTLVLVAAGPALYPLVLRGWSALIPARAGAAWYLARHEANYHLSRSTAAITPLFTGAALFGGLYTVAATSNPAVQALGSSGITLAASQVVLMFGGPILLAVYGAAVVLFMSNRTQGAEQALLRATGAEARTVIAAAALQAVIHVGTAMLLACLVLVTTAAVSALALSNFTPSTPIVDFAHAGSIGAIGCALTVTATLLPVAARGRRSVRTQLAAV